MECIVFGYYFVVVIVEFLSLFVELVVLPDDVLHAILNLLELESKLFLLGGALYLEVLLRLLDLLLFYFKIVYLSNVLLLLPLNLTLYPLLL